MFRSIRWKLVLIYLLLILFAIQLIGLYFVRSINTYFLDNFTRTIDSQTEILAQTILPKYLQVSPAEEQIKDMDYLANSFVQVTGGEIYLLNKNGVILATSGNKAYVGQKRLRTEVTRALLGTKDQIIRADEGTGQRYYFLAVPVKNNGEVVGAVYVVAPMQSMYRTISEINWIFVSGTLIALVITAILGVFLARTITNPIVDITKKAKAMAQGDFEQQVVIQSDDEIGELGATFNALTRQLRVALSENEQERDKLGAILTHMGEGVIATSGSGIILLINPSAQKLLDWEGRNPVGEPLSSLLMPMDADVDLRAMLVEPSAFLCTGNNNRTLQAYTSTFRRDIEGDYAYVIVLRDVTEEEQLEKARRDFVANVSHEIRTPLTTITSYLEALSDGAVEDPGIRARFLQVVQSEAHRMVRLVSELLQLSRLDSNREAWRVSAQDLRAILEDVVDRFAIPCKRAGIQLAIELPDSLPAVMVNRDQIDQVLDNLVSNAMKYSPSESFICVTVRALNLQWVEVEVYDSGIGIPEQDLPHIFERFYRVDKARSRKLGGTGLGLSIAKQIIEKHGGAIMAESALDQGTRIRFTLPIAPEEGVA